MSKYSKSETPSKTSWTHKMLNVTTFQFPESFACGWKLKLDAVPMFSYKFQVNRSSVSIVMAPQSWLVSYWDVKKKQGLLETCEKP